MKQIVIALVIISSIACDGRARDSGGAVVPYDGEVVTSNKNFAVGRLFVHEGYAVYRFYDGDIPVYYAVPASTSEKTATTSWQTKRWVGVAGKGGHYVYDNHQMTTIEPPVEPIHGSRTLVGMK